MIAVAWFALISWPLLTIAFFRLLSLPTALTVTIMGGYLFLPEQVGLDIPGLPALDKSAIPALSALLGVLIAPSRETVSGPKGIFPRSGLAVLLILLAVLGTIGTVLTNGDPFVLVRAEWHGNMFLPGLAPLRILPNLATLFFVLLPFLLARRYLASEEAQIKALRAMVLLALSYSMLALFEIRMSPQLNNWIYGFFPHSFAQHIRGGGYRPLVFLNHGLWLSLFLAMATLASVGMAKISTSNERVFYILAAAWLYMTLFLTKSLGAFLVVNVLIILFFQPRRIVALALAVIVSAVLAYPLLRSVDAVPVEKAADLAALIDEDRSDSLSFRFRHEAALLEHARERPVFGWGLFSRNLAAQVGDQMAVPDGRWVITFGAGGYAAFFSEFGLLALGVLGLAFRRGRLSPAALTIALILTANLVDLIPNATLTSLTWFWAGALLGRLEFREPTSQDQQTAAQDAGPPRKTVYARSPETLSSYRRADLGKGSLKR